MFLQMSQTEEEFDNEEEFAFVQYKMIDAESLRPFMASNDNLNFGKNGKAVGEILKLQFEQKGFCESIRNTTKKIVTMTFLHSKIKTGKCQYVVKYVFNGSRVRQTDMVYVEQFERGECKCGFRAFKRSATGDLVQKMQERTENPPSFVAMCMSYIFSVPVGELVKKVGDSFISFCESLVSPVLRVLLSLLSKLRQLGNQIDRRLNIVQ